MDSPDENPISENCSPPIAHSIKSACREAGNIGSSKLYEDIAAGRLIAHKNGRRTIIFHENLVAYLKNLPQLGE